MKKKLYAIIDLETTGGRAIRDKIIEIAIVLHDGEKIIDSFESFVNPERSIPYNITQITGISQEMVTDAPKFYELAKKIVQMTEGAIFVAHNVRFDYGFIREEFKRLGYSYSRRQLCTVRLSRKAFPGLRSYSLGNLIKHFKIKVNDRHRAMADTMATVELFEKILVQEDSEDKMSSLVNLGIKESQLPANITLEKLHQLPEECGVYYFYNKTGDVVYVGKSINIKKRVMEHFADKTDKGTKLQKHVHDISYELTGSELVALLFESHEIKRIRPAINKAQRNRQFPYAIHSYYNEKNYLCFGIARNSKKARESLNIIAEYPKVAVARAYLTSAVKNFELCQLHCELEHGQGPCFYFHIEQCRGACCGQETADIYNERASEAQEAMNIAFKEDFLVIDKGRSSEEKSVVLVENGEYKGFGYINVEEQSLHTEDLKDAIQFYQHNPETTRLIQVFLTKNKGVKIIRLNQEI